MFPPVRNDRDRPTDVTMLFRLLFKQSHANFNINHFQSCPDDSQQRTAVRYLLQLETLSLQMGSSIVHVYIKVNLWLFQ